MLLFLDLISPLPEFSVIEENKLIISKKIYENTEEKLSDNIFKTYLELEKNLNLSKIITKLCVTLGPGSYTSLRVGSAFLSGLKISNNLLFSPLTIMDILNFKCRKIKINSTAVYVNSSNHQNFFCWTDDNGKIKFKKIEKNNIIIPNNINTIFFNEKKMNLKNNLISQFKFSFLKEVTKNNQELVFKKNISIQPIYISNNKVLN